MAWAAPAAVTDTDHRPAAVPVYEVKKGKFVLVDMPDLKNRWPDKWEKEWLGW